MIRVSCFSSNQGAGHALIGEWLPARMSGHCLQTMSTWISQTRWRILFQKCLLRKRRGQRQTWSYPYSKSSSKSDFVCCRRSRRKRGSGSSKHARGLTFPQLRKASRHHGHPGSSRPPFPSRCAMLTTDLGCFFSLPVSADPLEKRTLASMRRSSRKFSSTRCGMLHRMKAGTLCKKLFRAGSVQLIRAAHISSRIRNWILQRPLRRSSMKIPMHGGGGKCERLKSRGKSSSKQRPKVPLCGWKLSSSRWRYPAGASAFFLSGVAYFVCRVKRHVFVVRAHVAVNR